MRHILLIHLLGILLLLNACPVFADTRITGFGSFVAGKTTSGQQFLADYPKTGIYDQDWSFDQDSSIGIQLSHDFNDDYAFVVQVNAHGAREYETEISWAYISYRINTELSVQLGRKRLPLYYYSDFFDVGYAYNWIRPPADNYTWQISHYNGVNLLYETQLGIWESSFNLYTGREDSRNNDLLSYLSAEDVDETWKNIIGVVGEFTRGWLNVRLTVMSSELDRTINEMVASQDVAQLFKGISLNLNIEDFSLQSEFNTYRRDDDHIDVQTRLLSLAYAVGDFTPYISYSEFEQKITLATGDECHSTRSVGVRWDFYRDTAFKIQFDKISDEGITSPVLGDSESLSLGIDVVF